ncbi:unnamed protein product [Rhodiola kirilowii]
MGAKRGSSWLESCVCLGQLQIHHRIREDLLTLLQFRPPCAIRLHLVLGFW